jgi:hypothetical protein
MSIIDALIIVNPMKPDYPPIWQQPELRNFAKQLWGISMSRHQSGGAPITRRTAKGAGRDGAMSRSVVPAGILCELPRIFCTLRLQSPSPPAWFFTQLRFAGGGSSAMESLRTLGSADRGAHPRPRPPAPAPASASSGRSPAPQWPDHHLAQRPGDRLYRLPRTQPAAPQGRRRVLRCRPRH